MTDTSPAGNVTADRMQELLSRAVEEQVSEQRAASSVLADVRNQLAALEASVRGAASDETVARLDSAVATVVADQRTATTLLSQRLEALTARVEDLARLAGDVEAQAEALDGVKSSLDTFGSFPTALAALQRDVSGLHSRLAPLADVHAAVGDLGARTTGSLDALRPQLAALESKISSIGTVPEADRLRDSVVDALSGRLERLQQAADRPVVGPEVLRSGLGDIRASITSATGSQLEPVAAALSALEEHLERVDARISDVGVLVGGIPGLASDLVGLKERVEALHGLRTQVEALVTETRALRSDDTGTATRAALEALSQEVAKLSAQVGHLPVPSTDEISAHVSVRVADRLVETLAPRIADVVLTRVSAALVNQLGEALAPHIKAQTEEVVRAATVESEKRVLHHVDEGLLTLAEALLRRKAVKRTAKPAPLPQETVIDVLDDVNAEVPAEPAAATEVPAPQGPPEPVATAPDPRPAVTTGLAPAPPAATAPAARRPAPPDEPAAAVSAREVAPVRPARPAARKAPAKAAPRAPKPDRTGAAAPARQPAKGVRPVTKARPRPLLDRTPDLDADVAPVRPAAPVAPVRPAAPRPGGVRAAPVPPASSPPAPAAPPAAPPSPAPPTAMPPSPYPSAPPAPAVRQAEPKRKPWWRPGG